MSKTAILEETAADQLPAIEGIDATVGVAASDLKSQLKEAHKEVMASHKRRQRAIDRLSATEQEMADSTEAAQTAAAKYSELMTKVTSL
jgi:hypothetical protein